MDATTSTTASTTKTTAASRSHDAILTLLDTYFEGLYQADSAMLATVFHPRMQYVSTAHDDFQVLTFPEYSQVLDQRKPPADSGAPRQEQVISIEVGSQNMAFAKVTMTMLGRDYTDFLTLVFHQDRWAIIAKIFDYKLTNRGG